jgi:hypothetical protein
MPRNITITFGDGTTHVYQNAPDNVTPDDVQARAEKEFAKTVSGIDGGAKPAPATKSQNEMRGEMLGRELKAVAAPLAGMGKGVGNIALGAQHYLGKGLQAVGATDVGGFLVDDAKTGRDSLTAQIAPYKEAAPFRTGAGELAGEVTATLPVGGALARLAGGSNRLATALRTSGMTTGTQATTLAGKAADLGIRTGAGAATGGVAAGLSNPDDALSGAIVGGALPGALKAVGGASQYAGNQVSNLVKPFTGKGQNELASNLFKSFATDPEKARQAMAFFKQVVPGSEPIAAAASGDVGLSNLTRTMQNASKDFAGDLQTRQWAQNAARTNAIESVAGNEGKIGVAKIARDKATDSMRSEALNAAGMVKSNQLVEALDLMAANPDSAGKLSQAALFELKNQILKASKNGEIDSRALYAIRKDINTTLGGKLSGDAGNLRYAAGELTGAKGAIDDAIEAAIQSSTYKPSGSKTGADLVTTGNSLVVGARKTPSFKGYLEEYTKQSKPINQMETLQDVMKRAQTGSVDNQGNLILSSAKLNNILKNETEELKKVLTDDQLQLIRNLSADTNASTLGMTAGKAVGSNTVQNIAQDNLLAGLMGQKMGGSTPVKMLLGNAFKPFYIRSNQAIMDKVGEALLSPKSGAAMLDTPAYRSKLQELLTSEEGKKLLLLLSKSAPVAIAQ